MSRDGDESFGFLRGEGPGGVEAGQVCSRNRYISVRRHPVSANKLVDEMKRSFIQGILTFSGSANLGRTRIVSCLSPGGVKAWNQDRMLLPGKLVRVVWSVVGHGVRSVSYVSC